MSNKIQNLIKSANEVDKKFSKTVKVVGLECNFTYMLAICLSKK